MAEIMMSDQVREVLGEHAGHVAATPLAGGHCPACRAGLDPDGPATVIVARSPHSVNVAFAHPWCMPSTVLDISDEQMAAAWPEDGLDMQVTAALVEHGRTVLPTLVAELTASVSAAQGPAGRLGELTNLVVSSLLGLGFVLVSRMREAPRMVAGWSAVLSPGIGDAARLEITDSRGEVFYEGTVYPPTDWLAAIEQYGWIVVYSGALHLTEPGQTRAMLRTTAAAGGLVGGRVPITWRQA